MTLRLRTRLLWLVPVAFAAHPAVAGADLWAAGDAHAVLAAETGRAAELADHDDAILRRIAIKEDLVAALVAGRADLADVTDRFLDLNAAAPANLAALRATVRGDSDRERAARNVIDYATARVADPAARADLRRRLDADLARLPAAAR